MSISLLGNRPVILAVEEINNEGGVNGREIEVIFEDGKCTGRDATSAAQKLINIDKVKIILGGGCSGETLAMAPIVEKNKVLLFSSMTTSPDITNAGDYVFRNSPSDLDSGRATAELASTNGVNKIAVIVENTDYATGFAKVFRQRFEELGGTVTSYELYAPETTEFRTIVSKAKNSNPDAVLISPQGESGGFIIKQLREVGYSGNLYGNVVTGNEATIAVTEGGGGAIL